MNLLDWTGEYCFSDSDNPAKISLGMLNNTKAQYYFTINGVNTPIFEAKPDLNNQITIYFNNILQDYLGSELPDFSAQLYINKVGTKALLGCQFYIAQGADEFGISVTMLNGGLSIYSYQGNSFFSPQIVVLTKQPATKIISRTQKEYISIIPKVSSANLLVNGVVKAVLPLQIQKINIIDVSPALIGVGADAKTYSIAFGGSSFVQTYEFAKPTQYRQKYFVFLNSLGVFETVLLRGLKESQNERSDKTASLNMKNYNNYKGKSFVVSVEKNKKMKVNTGYLKKTMLDYYSNELFFSKEIYEYLSPTDYRQIRITSKTVLESTENIDLLSLNFDCEYL